MTVKELIEKLQEFPPDAKVSIPEEVTHYEKYPRLEADSIVMVKKTIGNVVFLGTKEED